MRRVCRIHFCIGENMFCIGGMLEKNFLKFSQIFTFFSTFFLQIFAKNFRGARCGRSVGYTFSIGNFGGKKIYLKFSQIFSEYIFMYWQWRKIISNFLKFSLFFTFFHFFCKFLQKNSRMPDAAGLSDTFLVLEILVPNICPK